MMQLFKNITIINMKTILIDGSYLSIEPTEQQTKLKKNTHFLVILILLFLLSFADQTPQILGTDRCWNHSYGYTCTVHKHSPHKSNDKR